MGYERDRGKLTRRQVIVGAGASALLVNACADETEPGMVGEEGEVLPATPPFLQIDRPDEPEMFSFQGCGRRVLTPTPQCIVTDDGGDGPYYTRGAPERVDLLEPGLVGTPLIVEGRVLGSDCQPLRDAVLDVWQADRHGEYDDIGWRLRGLIRVRDDGRYRLDTIMPGYYAARPAHIHVKVRAPRLAEFTTQVYFDGDPRNSESIIESGLVMPVCMGSGGVVYAEFDFVLPT